MKPAVTLNLQDDITWLQFFHSILKCIDRYRPQIVVVDTNPTKLAMTLPASRSSRVGTAPTESPA